MTIPVTGDQDGPPRLGGVEHRFIELPSLRMHLAEAGAGDPLLLLHGVPQHWWEWREVIGPLAQHYRVICPDLRGAGWTDAPADGYDRAHLLADVVDLLDHLRIDSVRVISHDWSSLLAYQLCLEHPARVERHLALSIVPPYFDFDARMLIAMFRYLWFNLLVPIPGLGPGMLGRGRQRLARRMLRRSVDGSMAFSDEDLAVFLAPLREPARARAVSALYRRFIQPEAQRILRGKYAGTRLHTPTKVLIGAQDPNMRAELLHGYQRFCDEIDVEYVDGAGHFLADDRSDVVVRTAVEFFSRG